MPPRRSLAPVLLSPAETPPALNHCRAMSSLLPQENIDSATRKLKVPWDDGSCSTKEISGCQLRPDAPRVCARMPLPWRCGRICISPAARAVEELVASTGSIPTPARPSVTPSHVENLTIAPTPFAVVLVCALACMKRGDECYKYGRIAVLDQLDLSRSAHLPFHSI